MSGLFVLVDPNVQLVLEDGRASVVACSKAWLRIVRESLSYPPGMDHWPYLWLEAHPEPDRQSRAVVRIHVPIPKTTDGTADKSDSTLNGGMWDVQGDDATLTVERRDPWGFGSWIETACITFGDKFSCRFGPAPDHPTKVRIAADVYRLSWGERSVWVKSAIKTSVDASGNAREIRISFFAPLTSEAFLHIDAPHRLSSECLLVALGHGDSEKEWPAILLVPASEWVRRTFWMAWADGAGEANR